MQRGGGVWKKRGCIRAHTYSPRSPAGKKTKKKQEIKTRDPVELGRGLCPLGPCRINPQVFFYVIRCCSPMVGVRANLTQLFRSFQ